MVDLQDKDLRELNNRLRELNVKVANVASDQKRLSRHREEHSLRTRRLRKDIQKQEMELDNLNIKARKFDKKEFAFNNEERFLKKQIEEAMAHKRILTK